MRLVTLGGLAAIACGAVVVACSDRSSAPTASNFADGARLRIHGSSTLSIHTDAGVAVHALPAWSASGTMQAGIARDETATSPLGVLALSNSMRGEVDANGGNHVADFTDDAGDRHMIIWNFEPGGGPVRQVGYFVNGKLQNLTAYDWTRADAGWSLTSVTRRSFRNGKLASELTGSASGPADVVSRRATVNALALVARAAVRTFGPNEAHAQILSGKCRREWLEYLSAASALAAATIAIELAPGNTVLYFLWLAAAAKATQAEFQLFLCQENHPDPTTRSSSAPFFESVACKYTAGFPGCPTTPKDTQ